jgi:hypothetical protein
MKSFTILSLMGDAFLGNEVGPAPLHVCRMTVSSDPVDRFGLSACIAPCVSPLTEGAQRELLAKKRTGLD